MQENSAILVAEFEKSWFLNTLNSTWMITTLVTTHPFLENMGDSVPLSMGPENLV